MQESLSRRPLHTHLVAWQLYPFTNALLIAQSINFAFNYTLLVTDTGAHVEIKRQSCVTNTAAYIVLKNRVQGIGNCGRQRRYLIL